MLSSVDLFQLALDVFHSKRKNQGKLPELGMESNISIDSAV